MFNFNHPVVMFARSKDGAFGIDNKLPWNCRADLKWFSSMTRNHAVIMGRKTFESLPRGPLPNRVNLVVTRDKSYAREGVVVVASLADAMRYVMRNHPNCIPYVVGGVSLITEALKSARRAYVTTVDTSVINASNRDRVIMAPAIPVPHSVERQIRLGEYNRGTSGELTATVSFIDINGKAKSVYS